MKVGRWVDRGRGRRGVGVGCRTVILTLRQKVR